MPTIAECGGSSISKRASHRAGWPGISHGRSAPGRASMTKKLVRFGYLTLEAKEGFPAFGRWERIPAHEFHYSDSDCCGDGYLAQKPSGKCWGVRRGQREPLRRISPYPLWGNSPGGPSLF